MGEFVSVSSVITSGLGVRGVCTQGHSDRLRSCLLLELRLVDCHHDGVRLRRLVWGVDWGWTYLRLTVGFWAGGRLLALALSLVVLACGLCLAVVPWLSACLSSLVSGRSINVG